MDSINGVVNDAKFKAFFAILKAVRNGLMYGFKIRLPHSLVMTFLFHEGSIKDKLTFIIKSALEHGKRLAIFGFVYKTLGLAMKGYFGHAHPLQTFVASAAGGYCAFGTNTKIAMQVNMYLLSRVTIGISKLAVDKGILPSPSFDVFPLFAMAVWGIALLLFEYHPATLQPSLQNSMTYLHHDSSLWHNVADLVLYNSATLW